MYVTRRLSEYRKNPSELKKPPPEGPNSGVLVIQDEESLTTCCFGFCYEIFLRGLPFPQNAALTVRRDDGGQNNTVHRDPVVFIPVLGQPLSSNRYYTYERCGFYSRESSNSNEREVERVTCCFCIKFNHVHRSKKPQPDPYDIHQQVVITTNSSYSRCYYYAKPVAPNALLPVSLMRQGWTIENSTSTLQDFNLIDDAKGLNVELRSKLPGLDMNVVVGKWYVPFIFVKEGDIVDQVKISMYYNMTLHQRWEEVFVYENVDNDKACVEVVVDVDLELQVTNVEGQKINIKTTKVDAKGIVWFHVKDQEGQDKKIDFFISKLFLSFNNSDAKCVLKISIRKRLNFLVCRESSNSNEREVERVTCCFCIKFNHVHRSKKPQPDPYDIHQQVVITTNSSYSRCYYYAKPVAPNALLPVSLMRQGWTIENSTSTLQDFNLIDDAKGLNVELRSKLPGLDMNVVVGKWYVPFIFVKEGDIVDQVKISMYYNMTLHQRWEEVFVYENVDNDKACVEVVVDVDLELQVTNVEGQKINIKTTKVDAKGIVWFHVKDQEGQDKKIGLRSVVVERMESEEKSFGWKKIDGNRVKVKRVDRFEGGGSSQWKSYKCYVLVERFELKRMDGTSVLTYEFRHADKLRTIQY
ncbi:PREDICTED: uncharacterized protein LOC104778710 [Camelina sativa]|uniref:Uncharacterized protein LOC104778710 n=1 Tax=Camelina sativa TaxID=90675 RepID=A0ABM0YIM2_CAMSA|nr:PREDICTED: uncharacterized protein LOC104778710 [Camelina sativa]